MPNGEKTGGGDQWFWLFIVVLAVLVLSAGGFRFFRGDGIRFGSPSDKGTVEEKIEGGNLPPSVPLPNPVPLPPPASSSQGGPAPMATSSSI